MGFGQKGATVKPLLTLFLSVLQVAPTSSKQHGVNVSVNASATPFQQPSGYGSHGYSTGKRPTGKEHFAQQLGLLPVLLAVIRNAVLQQ